MRLFGHVEEVAHCVGVDLLIAKVDLVRHGARPVYELRFGDLQRHLTIPLINTCKRTFHCVEQGLPGRWANQSFYAIDAGLEIL